MCVHACVRVVYTCTYYVHLKGNAVAVALLCKRQRREGGREGGRVREGERERRREGGGRKEGRDGGREGEREGGSEGEREKGWEGGRDGGREGGRDKEGGGERHMEREREGVGRDGQSGRERVREG